MLEIRLSQRLPSSPHEVLLLLRCVGRSDTHHRVITIGWNDGPSISVDTLRIVPCLHGTNTPANLLPKHNDSAIRGTQVLQTMDGDRPLPNLRLIISRATLTGLIGVRFWKLAGEHDVTVGPPGWRGSWCLTDVAEFD